MKSPTEDMKLVIGKKKNINSAIARNIVDENDLIVTEDTHELAYVDDNKEVQTIQCRNKCFANEAKALADLTKSTDTYAGQIVMIADDRGVYNIFTVQQGLNGWEVRPNQSEQSVKLCWKKIERK